MLIYIKYPKFYTVTSSVGRPEPDRSGTTIGWIYIKKRIGFNYLGEGVYKCIDIFGNKFLRRSIEFEWKSFGNKLSHPDSLRNLIKLRQCYNNMLKRCLTPDTLSSKYYYGKVDIDPCWLGSEGFRCFALWAAICGYKDGLTIEKGAYKLYSPHTCKWVSRKENARNTPHSKLDIDKAREIKKEFAEYIGPKVKFYDQQATKYGVARDTIRYVVKGKRWAEEVPLDGK